MGTKKSAPLPATTDFLARFLCCPPGQIIPDFFDLLILFGQIRQLVWRKQNRCGQVLSAEFTFSVPTVENLTAAGRADKLIHE